MTIFNREDVFVARDFEGVIVECKRADIGTHIESGSFIICHEKIDKKEFWKYYNETKKYNPHFSKRDLLKSALMMHHRFLTGFALQDDWKIVFLADSMILKYKVKVQYCNEWNKY